jgi:hypothetical protein
VPVARTPPPLPPKRTVTREATKAFLEAVPETAPLAEVVNRRPKARKLEPHMIATVEQAMMLGATVENAARLIGVSAKTFSRWLEEADDEDCEDDLLLEFAAAAHAGRAKVVGRLTRALLEQAEENPKAAIEALRVLGGDAWNPAKKVEAKIDAEIGPRLDMTVLSQEERNALRDMELRALAAGKKALPGGR